MSTIIAKVPQRAFDATAKAASDPRPVMTSAILTEAAYGTWGASRVLRRLPDFPRAAGFRHLQHFVPA
jgi:hypothetical protein